MSRDHSAPSVRSGVRSQVASVSGHPRLVAGPMTVEPGSQTATLNIAVRGQAAPVSGHTRLVAGPMTVEPGSQTATLNIAVRSQAAPVSGHPRCEPTSRHPLQ